MYFFMYAVIDDRKYDFMGKLMNILSVEAHGFFCWRRGGIAFGSLPRSPVIPFRGQSLRFAGLVTGISNGLDGTGFIEEAGNGANHCLLSNQEGSKKIGK
jgi:hypothetical protein